MDAIDGMDLAARLSMEAKEYWVHLDAEGLLEKYPARQHARRVQEKLGVDEGLIYLTGQPAKNNEDSDMPAPFRQRRYFYYVTGCNEPSCHVTYDIQHDTLSLFIPRIDPKRVIWNGRGSTLAEAMEKYDVDEVYYTDELDDVIRDWSNYYGGRGSDIYVLHNDQLPQMPGLHANIDSESLQPAMNAARMIKDDHEINLIRKANDISSKAHAKVLANILKLKNEAQVEGLFMDVCISHKAKQQAYNPIAASGPNAGTLHYDANNEDFEDRQLMCLDAGCEFELYASDITRTFPLAKSWPSKEAENIYKLVELMQESCIERLAPGVRYLDLHILAHQIAIDGLLKLGILHNGTREEIYNAGTSRAFFPHGLGHHVGLEVHDVGQAELMSIRRGKMVLEQPPSLFPRDFHIPVYDPATCHAPTDAQSSQLEEGMVITIEPGIYFSAYALHHFYLPSRVHSHFINQNVLQRYMSVGGVRIEDDILITSKGYENLTTAPKGDAMFSIIRGENLNLKPAMRPAAASCAGTYGPPLLRAPGVPLQTAPPGLRLTHRAPFPPVRSVRENIGEADHCGRSSGFGSSMTTNERVEHWRRSFHRSSFPQPTSLNLQKANTLCGSVSRNNKHMYISSGCDPTQSQDQGLPHCTNCALLAQALGRLRQNLTLSEQETQKQVQSPHQFTSPSRTLPTPYAGDRASNTRRDTLSIVKEPERICAKAMQQGKYVCRFRTVPDCSLPPQQLRGSPLAPGPSPPQYARPPTSGGDQEVISKDIFNRPIIQEITNCHQHQANTHFRCTAELTQMDTTGQYTKVRGAEPYTSSEQRYAALKPQEALTIRSTILRNQEQRRLSNHTDDRDWMA